MKHKLLLSFALLSTVFCLSPVTASAQDLFGPAKEEACNGSQISDTAADCSGASGEVDNLLASIINILSIIVGVAAVIVLIINGLRFITSGGDSNSIASARNGVIYALVGLILVGLAQVIVRFVLTRTA